MTSVTCVTSVMSVTSVIFQVDHIDKAALYHIKCKLFLKSGDSWNEKGLGIANLKECNGKVCVRAHTSLCER